MKYCILLIWLISLSAFATAPEDKRITFGAFLDAYYGYDLNEPSGDRAFTTQALRHNEFAINLAYFEAKLDQDRTRGRVALQAGTSVYANYASERSTNSSLGGIIQHIQEAFAGYRISEGLWLDAGVFLSHIGAETFNSKDNWNYTRSLGADFSPYYQSGLRLSYQPEPKWFTSLHLMNGWQNIIETNSDKAVGVQVSFTPDDSLTLTYNNFIGREGELRFYNNFIVKLNVLPDLSVSFSGDIGFQGKSVWYVETLLAQYKVSEVLALGGRLEYFHDRDQTLVKTKTANGFQTGGASVNLDWQPVAHLVFRNEVRSLFSKDAVFPGGTGDRSSNTLLVSSLALSF